MKGGGSIADSMAMRLCGYDCGLSLMLYAGYRRVGILYEDDFHRELAVAKIVFATIPF